MEYSDLSKEQLLEIISDLTMLNDQLLEEKNQETSLNFSWSGNLGHWYWSIRSNKVTFNPLKVISLGYTEDEIPANVSYQFFTQLIHPDDHQATMDAMLAHLYKGAPVYEAEYRILCKDGSYRWYYDRGRITRRGADGKPLFLAGIVFDVTERKQRQIELEQLNRELSEKTQIDELTQIKNQRAILARIKNEMELSIRTGGKLSILMLDIDDFKRVNDNYGHVIGDTVLADVAAIISRSVRDKDLAGRYGGEEFLVVLSGADAKTAKSVANRIVRSVEANTFQENVRVTISCGIGLFEKESMPELIDKADKNLYEAKRQGKNRVVG
ncbi:MAG: sensor domain-containing diguanylate cyclase [Oscillospiraceae bacterium]|nr:sensor domain-containing diguanylate cyclase [Oscillospiraceae bacterium]